MDSLNNEKVNQIERINVVYCTDDNFVDVCCVSIISLLENKGREQVYIYIIDNSISQKGKEKILQIVNKFVDAYLEFLLFPKLEESLPVKVKYDKTHLSISTFGRLFIGNLLNKQIEKIIYLDCDTVVLKNLKELFEFDLKGYVIGGVDDCKSKRYRQVLGLSSTAKYINAGVLLIDLKKWREEECEKKIISYIERYNGKIHFEDQGAINAAINPYIIQLPICFNVMTHNFDMDFHELMKFRNPVMQYTPKIIRNAIQNPCIIHFTSSFLTKGRVWNSETNHKMKDVYVHYMKEASVTEKKYNPSAKNKIKFFVVNKLPRNFLITVGYVMHEIIEPIKYFCIMRVSKYGKK